MQTGQTAEKLYDAEKREQKLNTHQRHTISKYVIPFCYLCPAYMILHGVRAIVFIYLILYYLIRTRVERLIVRLAQSA